MITLSQNKGVQNHRKPTPKPITVNIDIIDNGLFICAIQACNNIYNTDTKNRVYTDHLGENPNMLKSLNVLL